MRISSDFPEIHPIKSSSEEVSLNKSSTEEFDVPQPSIATLHSNLLSSPGVAGSPRLSRPPPRGNAGKPPIVAASAAFARGEILGLRPLRPFIDRVPDSFAAAAAPTAYGCSMAFPWISPDPAVMGGKPCIRGLRITVGTIVGTIARGSDRERSLQAYLSTTGTCRHR